MTLMSCKGNKHEHFRPDCAAENLNIFKAKYKGQTLILNQKDLLAFYGQPNSEIKNCITISNVMSNPNIQYDCWIYEETSKFGFDVYEHNGY